MLFTICFQRMMGFSKKGLAGVFLILWGAATAFAQLPTATILGVVKDSTGAVVPGVTLTARNTDTAQSRTTVSGGDGSFRFSALPVGTYEMRATQSGFKAELRSGLTLTVGQEAVVNFTLEVGAVEQTVAVTADAPLVNTTSGSLGGLVNEQRVAELPLNGRNYIDLSLMQTGVSQHLNKSATTTLLVGMLFSSNGATLRSNNFLLDGAIMQSFTGVAAASTSGSTLGVEGIREYRLITSAFSAEYGLTAGSQMMIVSKGGTNSFHGSAFEFFRNSALDARNFFDYKTATQTRRLPPYVRNNFGGAFGGPIKKDKTFFYGVYEAIRERVGQTLITNTIPAGCHGSANGTVTNTDCPQLGTVASLTIPSVIRPLLAQYPVPNLPGDKLTFPFTQPTNENYGQMRVDQNFSNSDTMFVRYTIDNTQQVTPQIFPQFRVDRESRFQYLTLSEDHVFSPNVLNTTRLSFSRTNTFIDSPTDLVGPQYSLVPGQLIGSISIGAVSTLGTNNLSPNDKLQNIYTLSEDLFYSRGRHSLKFGTLMNRWQAFSLNGTNMKGTVNFSNIATFLQGVPNTIQAATVGSIFDRFYNYYSFGFYAQDDLRLRSNLTLNLGLRYEFQTTLTETHGHGAALRDIQHDANTTLGPPFQNPSLKNVSPRFGFAWDVKGDGKMAVRGGFGLLYDLSNMNGGLSAGVSATPPYSTLSSLPNPGSLTLPLTFPASAAGKALRGVDYFIQQPHFLQYNLTVERQLPFDMAVTLAYAGSRGINIPVINDGNPVVPGGIPQGVNCVARPASQTVDLSAPYCYLGTEPRTNPNWTGIELYTAGSNSWYNSMQFGLSKRLSKGLQFQSSYTWSHLMDESQSQVNSDNAATSDWTVNPIHRETDRSAASFDVTHNWRFNAIYRFPSSSSGGVMGKLLNGWRALGILSLQTGYPLTPALNSNRSRSKTGNGAAGIDRPDLVPGRSNDNIVSGTTAGCAGVKAGQQLGTPNLYYDPCAFTLPPLGFLGTAGRNIIRGPGEANLDFSLAKDTSIRALGESGRLEFRAEFFNILNRAAFGSPNRTVFAGSALSEPALVTAGTITTAGAARQIQFALKLIF